MIRGRELEFAGEELQSVAGNPNSPRRNRNSAARVGIRWGGITIIGREIRILRGEMGICGRQCAFVAENL